MHLNAPAELARQVAAITTMKQVQEPRQRGWILSWQMFTWDRPVVRGSELHLCGSDCVRCGNSRSLPIWHLFRGSDMIESLLFDNRRHLVRHRNQCRRSRFTRLPDQSKLWSVALHQCLWLLLRFPLSSAFTSASKRPRSS